MSCIRLCCMKLLDVSGRHSLGLLLTRLLEHHMPEFARRCDESASNEQPMIILLSLIHYLHWLSFLSQSHPCRILLCIDGSSLSIILHESDSFPAWNKPHFSKAIEATKDRRKTVNAVLIGQTLHEEDLVGR